MNEGKTINFLDEIYNEMQENEYVMSLPNAKIKYKSIYMDEISEDYIKFLLLNDGRFVFVNDNQFFLKSTFEYVISIFQHDIVQIERYLKENYFVKYIDRKSLMSLINSNRDTFGIKYGDVIYGINSIDDLYDVVKEEGFITYYVASAAAEYLELDYYDLLDEMYEIKVRVDDDSKFTKNCNILERKKASDTNYIEINNENILLIDLRANELIACFLALWYFNARCKNGYNNYFSNKHLSALYKMSIIKEQYNRHEVVLTSSGKSIIEGCERFLYSYNYRDCLLNEIIKSKNSRELAKSKLIKEINNNNLWFMIFEPIREIYLKNYYSKLLINLIAECNKNGIFNLGDIILFHLRNGKRESISELFVGDCASSGKKPIRENKDVCLHCKIQRCSDRGYITKEKLLYYRTSYVNKFIEDVSKGHANLDIIANDPLIIKFIVPYMLCSRTKEILIKSNCIKKDYVYRKESGNYCPFMDKWVIDDDILV